MITDKACTSKEGKVNISREREWDSWKEGQDEAEEGCDQRTPGTLEEGRHSKEEMSGVNNTTLDFCPESMSSAQLEQSPNISLEFPI